MGLDQHPARLVAAPGAAGDLLDLLEAALGGAQIAARQAEVGVDHPDQRQVGEMIALGDQLGADDDVDLAGLHRRDELGGARRRPDGVGGDDRGARFGKQRGDLVGDALDPGADGDQAVLLAAFGAGACGGGMTWPQWWQARRCISRCSTIQAVQLGHWKRWPQWRHRVSGAKPRRLRNSKDCSPASRLARSSSTRLGASQRPRGGGSWVMSMARIVGQRRAGEAVGQRDFAVAADLDHVPALDRRGRRRQDHRHVLELAAHHRDVAGVVLDAFLLLEAGLVGLVDDDQAELGVGQEQRRAGADDDLGLAAGDRPPGAAALRRAQVGMPGDRGAAEARLEALEERLGQRDLGQQHQRLLALAKRLGDRLEIDLGLARAGDPVEQHRVEALADRGGQAGGGGALLGVEVGRGEIGVGAFERAVGLDRDRFERAGVDQPAQHGVADLGVVRRARGSCPAGLRARRAPSARCGVMRSGTRPVGRYSVSWREPSSALDDGRIIRSTDASGRR